MREDVSCGTSLAVPWIPADYATTGKRQHQNTESASECKEKGEGGSFRDENDPDYLIMDHDGDTEQMREGPR